MSNSNFNTNTNSSPYSHLYDQNIAGGGNVTNLSDPGKVMIDPYNKHSQTGTISNYLTNSPSNTNTKNSESNLINKNQSTQPSPPHKQDQLLNYNLTASSHSNQPKKLTPSNSPNLTYPSSHFSHEKPNLKKIYIEKVSHDINLLPNQYKDPIKRLNNLFVTFSCIYPLYALFYFVKDYPEITPLSKKKILLSSSLYVGFFLFVNHFYQKQYERSYKFLRNVYTDEELMNMVNQYHDANNQQLVNQFFSNQETDMNNQGARY
jgi:hypothetical protein